MSTPYDNDKPGGHDTPGGRDMPGSSNRPAGPPPGARPGPPPGARPGPPPGVRRDAQGRPLGPPPGARPGPPPPVRRDAQGRPIPPQMPRDAQGRPLPAQGSPQQRGAQGPPPPRGAQGPPPPRGAQGPPPGRPPLPTPGRPPTGPPHDNVPRSSGSEPPEPPERGSAAKTNSKSRWRTVRKTILALFAIGLIVPILAFMVAYVIVDVPRPGDIKTNQVATIFASDGTSELARVVPPEGNRTDVEIQTIPLHVRNAVLSAEDRDFYSNPGFSITGFARAARDNVLGRDSAGGGSTITQQYVKNALVGSERTLTRKMKELVIASKMARQWSKDDILAAYLNTIYFGRGAYGIAAASTAYFGKPVEQLSIEEGAALAAIIQQPSGLDPEFNLEGAQARWDYVLDGMVEQGNLEQAQRESMQFPQWVPSAQSAVGDADSGPNGLIKAQVLRELSAAGVSEQDLNTEGLQITTTIDPAAQAETIESVNTNMEGESPELRTASVSIDPRTGAVRAYYGGADGAGFDFAQSGLQTGSSFKVFGLAAALDQGIPLSQMYDSSPLTVDGIEIGNVEGASCGTCTIAEALKRSLNTSFYRMQLSMDDGPQSIADMAHRLGVAEELPGVGPTLTEPNGNGPNNGIVLGQYQSRVIDMASAYATLAASGVHHDPYFVQRVVTADGSVLLDRGEEPGEQVVPAAVADNVTSAMRPIAGYSNGHDLAGGRASAAKTGTAQLGDTGDNKDAWMVGYTPSLSTAVWVGTEQGLPLENSYGGPIYGSGLPSDIWKDAMDGALNGTSNESFPTPEPIAGQAGVPVYSAPAAPEPTRQQQQPTAEQPPVTLPIPTEISPPVVITPRQVEILPGVTIPLPGLAPAPAQDDSGVPEDPAAEDPASEDPAQESELDPAG